MVNPPCYSRETLSQFELGRLDENLSAEIESHLETCPACADRFLEPLETPDELVQDLRAAFPSGILKEDAEVRQLVESAIARLETLSNCRDETQASPLEPPEGFFARLLSPSRTGREIGWLGKYRILEVLGTGGMGLVLKAEDPELRREVAIKVMSPAVAATSGSGVERFLREARAMASLEHDHIVTIYNVDCSGHVPYFAMPLLKGQPLSGLLATDTPPIPETLRVVREIASGLAAAHAKGLTHRDIKPGNVWIEAGSGRVKILDFGLAQVVAESGNLTQSGAIIGTPNYLSPEQARGEAVDARSDLFALGVVLYQMLTGSVPFVRGHALATLKAIELDTPKPPRELNPEVSPELSAMVMRLLEKDPARRLQTAEEIVAAIQELERRQTVGGNGTIPTAVTDSVERPRRRGWGIALGCVAAAALLAAIVIRMKTDYGTIVVQAGQGFEVTSSNQVLTIRDTQTNRTYKVQVNETSRLPSGEYAILVEDNEGLKFTATNFQIKRGDRDLLVQLEPAGPEPPRVPEPARSFLSPMSPTALVQHPAKLGDYKGEPVESWTIAPEQASYAPKPALHPEGELLACFADDGSIQVWNVQTRKLQKILFGHADGPCQDFNRTNSRHFGPIVWSPVKGSVSLATASRDGSVRIWDTATGKTLWQEAGDPGSLQMLAWSPDGSRLAIGYSDGRVRSLNTSDWTELRTLRLADRAPQSLMWSPDGRWLAIHSQAAQVWNPVTGEHKSFENPRHQRYHPLIFATPVFRWSSDGTQLAFAASDSIRILETATWIETARLSQNEEKPPAPEDFAWSPQGVQIVVGWENATTTWHDLSAKRMVTNQDPDLVGHLVTHVEWGPQTSLVCLGCLDPSTVFGRMRVLNADTQEVSEMPADPKSGNRGERFHEFSADGRLLLLTGDGLSAVVRTGNMESALVVWNGPPKPPPYVFPSWSPDNRWLILPGQWDREATDPKFSYHPLSINSSLLGWSPDASRGFFYDGATGTEHSIRSMPGRELIHPLKTSTQVIGWCWSPDGSRLAVCTLGGAGKILIVDAGTGKTETEWVLADHPRINSLAWSRRGDRLAAADPHQGVVILDAASGKILKRVQDLPLGSVFNHLRWSPDDSRLMICRDEELLVFDASRQSITNRIPIQAKAGAIHWTDGETILAGTRDGLLVRINFQTGNQEILARNLGEPVETSPEGQFLASMLAGSVRATRLQDQRLVASFLTQGADTSYVINSEGHVWQQSDPRGTFWAPKVSSLWYVVQTRSGQHLLSPLEFAAEFQWRNDPLRCRLK